MVKSRQAVLFLALVLFHYYERESWRDERLREGYARADTHTHTQRERRCVIARFVRVTREREIDAFFFRGVTDELIQTRERGRSYRKR